MISGPMPSPYATVIGVLFAILFMCGVRTPTLTIGERATTPFCCSLAFECGFAFLHVFKYISPGTRVKKHEVNRQQQATRM
ncbi:MAG: hypothetical protein NVS2B12_30050 [Ktedonobacteraceae bacterium]